MRWRLRAGFAIVPTSRRDTLTRTLAPMNRPMDRKVPADAKPVRILHLVGVLNRAGIETWLLHMLRGIDRKRFVMDFAVETDQRGDYDDEVRRLGATIHCLGPRNAFTYGRRLSTLLRDRGGFEVLHSHYNHFSGYAMRVARGAQVPMRIAHSHTDSTIRDNHRGWKRKLYVRQMRRWLLRHATHGLAASEPAAAALFGSDWRERGLCRVMHCSVDLAPFTVAHDRDTIRDELSIPRDAWVIGQVGRMADVKNHRLTIEAFAAVLQQAPDAFLLLIGDGPLRGELASLVTQLGIDSRVRFAGNRNDVPRLLCAAMDLFAMPSKYEGLPLAILEAQAAGLPCIVSDGVAKEAAALPELITWLSIDRPWAPVMLGLRRHQRQSQHCLAQMQQSDFSMEQGVASLESLYSLAKHDR